MITRHDLIFTDAGNPAADSHFTSISSGNPAEGDHFEFVIADKTGIHARPAGGIAEIAKRYNSEITIEANGKTCSARSVVGLMTLGAAEGTRLVCRASGPEHVQALQALYQYMKENLQ